MAVYKQIGKKMPLQVIREFKVWLVRNNLTLTQFALKCGVSKQYISSLTKQRFYLTPKIIEMFDNQGFHINIKKDRY